MNKKSFVLGIITGIVLTIVALFAIAAIARCSSNNDSIKYLEKPVSYENKAEANFRIIQVFDNGALATDQSNFNVVVIPGENYYDDQNVKVKNPQRVGSYTYPTNSGMEKTVPIINGDIIL